MIKYDINAANHYISIRESQTFIFNLGFSWNIDGKVVFFRYLILAFGLRSAPYCFIKLVRHLVKKWRSESKIVLKYLDDGFICDATRLFCMC